MIQTPDSTCRCLPLELAKEAVTKQRLIPEGRSEKEIDESADERIKNNQNKPGKKVCYVGK